MAAGSIPVTGIRMVIQLTEQKIREPRFPRTPSFHCGLRMGSEGCTGSAVENFVF
uniref:Uncharacterized protein n=1 Tax=viral metagenome TaxID=1070528 RepID=A0A6C0F2P4_9ZZZZ